MVEHSTMPKTTCTTKGHLVPNVHSAEVEKPWTRPMRVFGGSDFHSANREEGRGLQHGGTSTKGEPSKLPNLPLPGGQGEEEGAMGCDPLSCWESR